MILDNYRGDVLLNMNTSDVHHLLKRVSDIKVEVIRLESSIKQLENDSGRLAVGVSELDVIDVDSEDEVELVSEQRYGIDMFDSDSDIEEVDEYYPDKVVYSRDSGGRMTSQYHTLKCGHAKTFDGTFYKNHSWRERTFETKKEYEQFKGSCPSKACKMCIKK